MDGENLHQVIKALAEIRKMVGCGDNNGIQPVSHVVLCKLRVPFFINTIANHRLNVIVHLDGDVSAEEGMKLRGEFAKELDVVWIGTPFQSAEKNGVAHDVWVSFKSNNLDYMPVEIKVMGILLALKKRHGARLACIGFRSGSLDGAAFLGIPTFSLDNKIVKDRAKRIEKKNNKNNDKNEVSCKNQHASKR